MLKTFPKLFLIKLNEVFEPPNSIFRVISNGVIALKFFLFSSVYPGVLMRQGLMGNQWKKRCLEQALLQLFFGTIEKFIQKCKLQTKKLVSGKSKNIWDTSAFTLSKEELDIQLHLVKGRETIATKR